MKSTNEFSKFAGAYLGRLQEAGSRIPLDRVEELGQALLDCWKTGRQVFIIGNGGSAGNAIHLANDFIYGISKTLGSGIRMHALPANQAMLSCLGNDLGYDRVFSEQLAVMGSRGDLLIALSGSGNSPNILRAIDQARLLQIRSFAILGYTGGKALELCDCAIHVPVNDMQISEDSQLIVGHILMQWLYAQRDSVSSVGYTS
jgi:D-sedoheptulose 7-phosphate isomerase